MSEKKKNENHITSQTVLICCSLFFLLSSCCPKFSYLKATCNSASAPDYFDHPDLLVRICASICLSHYLGKARKIGKSSFTYGASKTKESENFLVGMPSFTSSACIAQHFWKLGSS